MSMDKTSIRNFVIIAHIDHGKSTLADRFLEHTHTVENRKMKEQYLDRLELERERGITIKMAPVRMTYSVHHSETRNSNSEFRNEFKIQNSKFEIPNSEYILNLIDTPGHSDFSYEVSRALDAVEGAILLVDATQGIQAQTLANFYAAKKAGLTIIGALNKVDLIARGDIHTISGMRRELADLIECDESEILAVSGKTGENVPVLLDEIVRRIPPPRDENPGELRGRGLVFDSFYDNHKGVIASIRVFGGTFDETDTVRMIGTGVRSKIKELGVFVPEMKTKRSIGDGEIGYIATGIKDIEKIKIGDTVVAYDETRISKDSLGRYALSGYKEPKPVIFVSFYPEDSGEYDMLRQNLQKLKLNDSALSIEPDQNEVLGRGFKVGCLGRLHYEITTERLKREFETGVINTFPSVRYMVKLKNGETMWIVKPEDLPNDFLEIWEPTIALDIIFPRAYLSNVFSIQKKFRISDVRTETAGDRIKLSAVMPLAELVSDFDDHLKSVSEGYASFSYEIREYIPADIVRVDLLVSGKVVPGLSRFLPKESFEREARRMVEKLKDLLPKQQFAQPIQASAQGRIIARADIPAIRKELGIFGKNGGDRTRKMKLWKKQKRGKERLKERSEASISPSVFKELLRKE